MTANVIGALLRVYSYLYHLILALFLLGMWLAARLLGGQRWQLEMLPWTGEHLNTALMLWALAGLLCLFLAWVGKLRLLFLLYTVWVFAILFRGFFLSRYTFGGEEGFHTAILVTVGALLAIPGAWSQFRRKAPRRR